MHDSFSPKIKSLVDALKTLPGVGKKTSQRMAIQLLDKNRDGAEKLASSIVDALTSIKNCQRCQVLTDTTYCSICSNNNRDDKQLCIVENMLDLVAIEESGGFKGKYFVLHGCISPLDGVGPADLKLPDLDNMVSKYEVEEVVMALSPSVESETTIHFISDMLSKYSCKVSRIGFGIPFGGELEYLDQQTILHAFSAKTEF